jgi:hypothetical protein
MTAATSQLNSQQKHKIFSLLLRPPCRHRRNIARCALLSALPPKADMFDATRDVRFGPIADSKVMNLASRGRVFRLLQQALQGMRI